jgi:hypothetical protein
MARALPCSLVRGVKSRQMAGLQTISTAAIKTLEKAG